MANSTTWAQDGRHEDGRHKDGCHKMDSIRYYQAADDTWMFGPSWKH